MMTIVLDQGWTWGEMLAVWALTTCFVGIVLGFLGYLLAALRRILSR